MLKLERHTVLFSLAGEERASMQLERLALVEAKELPSSLRTLHNFFFDMIKNDPTKLKRTTPYTTCNTWILISKIKFSMKKMLQLTLLLYYA